MSEQETTATENKPDEEKKKEGGEASFGTAVISLVNSTLGSGMLGIPLAYAKAGLIPALTLHIIMGVLSWMSFYFITYATEALGEYSYGGIAKKLFGYTGILIVEICTFSYTFGPLWSYCILIGDFLPSVLRGVGVPSDSIFTNRIFVIVMIAFFIVQPLSWLRSLNSLRFTSFFGMISMMFCVVVIMIRYFAPSDNLVDKDNVEAVHASPSMIQTFSTLCFAFGCHQNIPLIQDEIYEKSTKTMNRVTVVSVSIVGLCYMLAGLFGYLTFTSIFFDFDSSGNVLTLYKDKDYLVFAARIASLITVIFCCPMNSYPARICLYNIVKAIRYMYRKRKKSEEIPLEPTDKKEGSEETGEATSSDNQEGEGKEGTDKDNNEIKEEVKNPPSSSSEEPSQPPFTTSSSSQFERSSESPREDGDNEQDEDEDKEKNKEEKETEKTQEEKDKEKLDKEKEDNEKFEKEKEEEDFKKFQNSQNRYVDYEAADNAPSPGFIDDPRYVQNSPALNYSSSRPGSEMSEYSQTSSGTASPTFDGLEEKSKDPNSWLNKKYLCLTGDVWRSTLVGSVMVFLGALLAIALSQVNFVFDFLGSTAGVAVAFLIPGMMFLRVIRHPDVYVDVNRDPHTTRPEGLEEFRRRTEKMLVPDKGCTCGVFLSWLLFFAGLVFGVFSLAMAIIFDTPLSDKVNF